MNISTTPRRLAQGLLVLCFTLATVVGAQAQCSDFVSFPGTPVTINLTLDAFGNVNLTNAVLNANGFVKNAACDFWLTQAPNDPNDPNLYDHTPIGFTCADVSTSPQTWYVRVGGGPPYPPGMITDDMGPGATIVQITVNVIDNIAPTISCPPNQVRNADAICKYTAVGAEFDYTAVNDNCAANTSYVLTNATSANVDPAATLAGVVFNLGTTNVTWKVKDNAIPTANTASCAFTVTVNDATPPVITCPPNQNVGTDNPTCTYTYVGGNATATDNCGVTSITNSVNGTSVLAGAVFNAGVNGASLATNVTWTASDGINSVNCIQSITVTDDDAPAFLSCPLPMTVSASAPVACDYIGTAALNATASDNCSAVSYSNSFDASSSLVGAVFPLGGSPFTITWTATDVQGNSISNCTFTLTVKDMTPPSVMGVPPVTTTLNVTAGDCAKVVTFTRPDFGTVTDCGPVTMTEAWFSGPDPDVLTGAPAFSPGSTITVQFPAGTTVIRYTWSDNAVPANTTTVDYTFIIVENDPPVANCVTGPVSVVLDAQFNGVLITPAMVNNGSMDNCGIASMAVTPPLLDCSQLGLQNVTLTVTDNNGNTDDCTTTVFVADATLPLMGCPASFVVAANANCMASVANLIFFPTANIPPTPSTLEYYDNTADGCGLDFDYKINANPFVALGNFVSTPVDLSTLVFSAGLNTLTLRAKDVSGNLAVCNMSINVQDQTGPTVTCPTPTVSPLLIGSCTAVATWPNPTATDNCPGVISFSSTFPSGFSFPGGTTVVTYTAVDVAGNIGTCTFNVVVVDNQLPVANCKNITVNLSSTIGAGSVTVTPGMVDNLSTDNCGYSYVSPNATYTCANIGTNDYTLQIQDAAGNPASCVAVVTVQDVTAPTFICPANMMVNANASCQGLISGTATATDNCSIVKYEYDLDPPAGTSFALLNNGASGNLANVPALPLGVTTVTLRASDNATPANSSTCSFTVTVKDVTPPVFAGVPVNVTVNCDAIPPITNPTATDNCGSATVSFSGQTFSAGTCTFTITRTWVASDNAVPANTVSVSQVITVQDVIGPVFNPSFIPTGTVNVNVAGPANCNGNYTLTVVNITDIADACNGVSGIAYNLVPASGMSSSGNLTNAMGTFTLPVSSFPIGTNVVTLTASDGCGNTTTKVVNIVVTDNQAPVFQNAYAAAPAGICGKVFTLPNTTNNCDQLFTWTRPSVSDIFDCGSFTVTESISNPTVQAFVSLLFPFTFPPAAANVVAQFPVGETTVTYTATQGMNVSTCSFVVKILDTQAPTITCPGNQNLSVSAACSAAATVPTYPPATVLDNCPNNVSITQTPAAGSLVSNSVPVVPGNTFTVTLKATDNFPNNLMSAPCSFTVTLVDSQSPQPLITSLPDIVSNCTKDTVLAPLATDCNGTDIDTIYGTPSVAVMMVLPPAFPGGPPSYVLNPGNYVITWSYTDPQNNTTTQPQNVFITVDVTGPIAIAQPLSINLDAMGNASIAATQLNNGSFDQDGCGPVTVSIRTGTGPNFVYVDSLDFDCSHLANMGVNTVIFAATDINGNTTTVATTVTVHDVTPPSFTNPWTAGQMDTVIQACQPIPPAASFPQTATDQCDLVVNIALTETSTQTANGCSHYSYVINRKWTATDDSGNSVMRTQKIIVADTQAPVFAAATPDTIMANTAPNALVCNAVVAFNMANFVSDCQTGDDVQITNTLISAPVGNTFVIPSGSNIGAPNYPVGTYVVRFTAKDSCGNSSTKDLTVVVKDATPPTAVCINGVSASLQPSGTVVVTVNQFNNNSYDNCTSNLDLLIQRLDVVPLVPPTPSLEYDCDDADGQTQHGVKLFVADEVGNMSMCQTYIVIQDNVAPAITCPPNKTVQCTDILTPAVQGTATATDNCPIVPDSISFTDMIGGGVGNICQVLTRTWKVIDLADNVTTCNQLISIQDTVKPTFTFLPPNVTVSCSDGSIAVTPVGATDNCDPNVTMVLTVDTISIAQGDCGLFDYTIVRTWMATDDCGNSNVHTRLIKVVDITEPVFAGMPDSITIKTSQFPPNLTCTAPVNLNVLQFVQDCSPDSLLLITNDAPFGNHSTDISGNYPIGSYWVNFSAIDACGNVGIDSIHIEVVDNSVPTMVCNNNVVISLGTNGEATIDAADIDLGSTDNCAIDTLVLSQTLFDCSDLGFQNITLTATDIFGNTNSCAVQVEVTLGVNAGFTLVASGSAELYFGAANGTATAVATGGTGLFGFAWSSGDTTAVVDSLAAGTYTVSVTDLNSGCISVDTIVVDAGPKITIHVGTGDGCQNETLSIPVTVDNFINVSGFSFGVTLSNALAGMVTGLSNPNPALIGVNIVPGANSIFWTHPTLAPTTLPNGSVLFNIEIQLANAAQGTSSNIVASAIPALVFLQDETFQAPMVIFNNGSVSISCPAADLQLAGDVFTWKAPVKPVPGVDITLAGTVNATDVTALPDADYQFGVPTGANTVTSAAKINLVKNNKINVGDMLAIQAHAALQVAFTNPFQWVAADINSDLRVNLVDYALVQAYVLGSSPHFPGVITPLDWKFVAESHVFAPLPIGNPAPPLLNPLNNPVPPATIPHMNVAMDFLDDDFVAVLMGDVNGDVIPLTGNDPGAEYADVLKFRLDDRAVQAGEFVTIPFKAKDFTAQQAYQMTLTFDPEAFELQGIEPGVLPGLSEANFGTGSLADGMLTTLWVGAKAMSFDDNETLFSLTFKALKNVPALSGALGVNSDITEAMAIDQEGNILSVDVEFVTSVSTTVAENKTFALYQNQPNPFSAETTISFRLPESGRASLRVFSAEGRLVKTVIGEFAAGNHTVTFRKSDFGSNGVYYYELETPKHSDRKKMILID